MILCVLVNMLGRTVGWWGGFIRRRLRGALPFGVVGNKEGRGRKESADEEGKMKGPPQSSGTTRHFLSEQLRTVLFLSFMFSYCFLNTIRPPAAPVFHVLLNYSFTESHIKTSIFKSGFVTRQVLTGSQVRPVFKQSVCFRVPAGQEGQSFQSRRKD